MKTSGAHFGAALCYHSADRRLDAAVAETKAALFERRPSGFFVGLLALYIGLADSHLQWRAALRLLEFASLFGQLCSALVDKFLRGRDSGLVEKHGLGLGCSRCPGVLIICARDEFSLKRDWNWAKSTWSWSFTAWDSFNSPPRFRGHVERLRAQPQKRRPPPVARPDHHDC